MSETAGVEVRYDERGWPMVDCPSGLPGHRMWWIGSVFFVCDVCKPAPKGKGNIFGLQMEAE